MVSTSFGRFSSFPKTKWRSPRHIEVESSGDPHPTHANTRFHLILELCDGDALRVIQNSLYSYIKDMNSNRTSTTAPKEHTQNFLKLNK
jgi:hypothetical protein